MSGEGFFLTATAGRLIILEDAFKEQSKLIVTPELAKRRPTTGRIVDVGPACPETFEIGKRVLFTQFSGTGVNFKGKPAYRVLSADEVVAFINTEDENLEGVVA